MKALVRTLDHLILAGTPRGRRCDGRVVAPAIGAPQLRSWEEATFVKSQGRYLGSCSTPRQP